MISVSLHRPTGAKAGSVRDTHWVEIKSEDGGEVTIFCAAPEKARAIADAINGTASVEVAA